MLPRCSSCIVCKKTLKQEAVSIKQSAPSTGDCLFLRLYDIFGTKFQEGSLCFICHGLIEEYDNYIQCLKTTESQIRLRTKLRHRATNNMKPHNVPLKTKESGFKKIKSYALSDVEEGISKRLTNDAVHYQSNDRYGRCRKTTESQICPRIEPHDSSKNSSYSAPRVKTSKIKSNKRRRASDMEDEYLKRSRMDVTVEIGDDGTIHISDEEARKFFIEDSVNKEDAKESNQLEIVSSPNIPELRNLSPDSSVLDSDTCKPQPDGPITTGSTLSSFKPQGGKSHQEMTSSPEKDKLQANHPKLKVGSIFASLKQFADAIGQLKCLPENSNCSIRIDGVRSAEPSPEFPYARIHVLCDTASVPGCPWSVEAIDLCDGKGYKVTGTCFEHHHDLESSTHTTLAPEAVNQVSEKLTAVPEHEAEVPEALAETVIEMPEGLTEVPPAEHEVTLTAFDDNSCPDALENGYEMKIGAVFPNFKIFKEVFDQFCIENLTVVRVTNTVSNHPLDRTEESPYKTLRYACIHGPKKTSSKSTGKRKATTLSVDCPWFVIINYQEELQKYNVKDACFEHRNHDVSELAYSQRKKLTPAEREYYGRKALQLKPGDQELMKELIKTIFNETGKTVNRQTVWNLKNGFIKREAKI